MSRNSETAQTDDVQIIIGNGTTENKSLTNDTEEDSRQKQILSDCDNEQRAEEHGDVILNDKSSSRRYDNSNCENSKFCGKLQLQASNK